MGKQQPSSSTDVGDVGIGLTFFQKGMSAKQGVKQLPSTLATASVSLDIVQERMLSGLAGLRQKNPRQKMFTLGHVFDEVRQQTKLRVALSLKEMAEAKRPLLDRGLIEDLGCGYDITEHGIRVFKQMNRIAA